MKPACTANSTPCISRYVATQSAARPSRKRVSAAAVTAIALAVVLMPVTIDSARSNLARCVDSHATQAGVNPNVSTADSRYRASHLEAIAACSRGI
ncbi:hypothetical protein [Burkholderia sp. L27(2015)]|uniref:hypothetical protein n=1 Tax=Burkholderia sp. L27(2015) TaxID=1641858 RepID=UPI00131D3ECC|nr:hypothetical protein [Burkholderia sp. L27(2015)]